MINQKMIEHLQSPEVSWVLREGKKITLTLNRKSKYAIIEVLLFKKEVYAKEIEDWYEKNYGAEK